MTARLAMGRSRRQLPRRTVRFRLTVLYSGLFLLAGAGLLAITYLLVDRATATALFVTAKGGGVIAVKGSLAGLSRGSPTWRATPTWSSAWPRTWWTTRSATTCREDASTF
jgi:hypothetical protein